MKKNSKENNTKHDQYSEMKIKKRKYNKAYAQRPEVKKRVNKNQKHRRKNNIKLKLSELISKRMYRSIKKGTKNYRHWEDLVGYTAKELEIRLKKTMPKGYTWQDFLDGKLHVDHIIPVSVFNFNKPEHVDFKKCFALSNLQLLPAKENLRKSSKLYQDFQPSFAF